LLLEEKNKMNPKSLVNQLLPLFVGLGVVLGLAACEDPFSEPFDIGGAITSSLAKVPSLYVKPEPGNDSFGVARSWIGWNELGYMPSWTNERVCPIPKPQEAWRVSRLFSRSNILAELGAGVPGGLSSSQISIMDAFVKINGTPDQSHTPSNLGAYCHYEWAGEAGDLPAAIGWLPWSSNGQSPLAWLFADQPQLTAQSPVDEWLAQRAAATYHAAVAPQMGSAMLPPQPPSAGRVRVAILDSAVNQFNGLPGQGNLRHGREVALLIREAACSQNPASCPVHIAHHLALHMVPDGAGGAVSDHVNGGYFGTVGRLAQTLFLSVLEWRLSDPAARLIVNMSIGFDILSTQKPDWAQFQAVLDALKFVRQSGALPIAAAGNVRAGSVALTGPMWPARAETLAAPSGTPASTSSYRPLVYSAAGRDGLLQPLSVTRSAGKPRLAAYAYSVVSDEGYADGSASGEFKGLGLTGSSMASAAVSASAAVAWAYAPWLPADDVMERVYSSALPLRSTANYRLAGPHGNQIRLVSVCEAAKAALWGTAHQWNDSCPTRPHGNPTWHPTMLAVASMFGTTHTPAFQTTDVPKCDPSTNVYTFNYTSTVGSLPCPDFQLYNSQGGPQVEPQPNSPICPNCTFYNSWKRLVMVANPYTFNWATAVYTNVRLKLKGTYAWLPWIYTVSFDVSDQYNPQSTVVVNNLDPPAGFHPIQAEVTGVLNYLGQQTVVLQQINLQ
jgi:hypothetical protein